MSEEKTDFEIKAHHLDLYYVAMKEGGSQTVDSIVAMTDRNHNVLIGEDGTKIKYKEDVLGENNSGEAAYRKGLKTFFDKIQSLSDNDKVLLSKRKDGVCMSCAHGVHCDFITEEAKKYPDLDRDTRTLYTVLLYFLKESKNNPDVLKDIELISLTDNPDDVDDYFDICGYRLPAKYLKSNHFMDFVSDPMSYHDNKYLLDE